jgi:hypothetical protein
MILYSYLTDIYVHTDRDHDNRQNTRNTNAVDLERSTAWLSYTSLAIGFLGQACKQQQKQTDFACDVRDITGLTGLLILRKFPM